MINFEQNCFFFNLENLNFPSFFEKEEADFASEHETV